MNFTNSVLIILFIVFCMLSLTIYYYREDRCMDRNVKEMFKLSTEMTSKKCKTNSMIKQYEKFLTQYNHYQNVTNVLKPELLDKFNTSFQNYKTVYETLQDCKDYCVNGKYEQKTASCICSDQTSIPFVYKDKTYCLSPEQIKDTTRPGFFEDIPKTDQIVYDEENETISPKNAPSFKVYGKYTNDKKSMYVLSQSGLIDQPVIIKEKSTSNVNECIYECLRTQEATSFAYDGQKCMLFSNKNVKLTDFPEGSYIVGTKTSPV